MEQNNVSKTFWQFRQVQEPTLLSLTVIKNRYGSYPECKINWLPLGDQQVSAECQPI